MDRPGDALQQVSRDLVAPALGSDEGLQVPVEVGVIRARPAEDEMLLDLHPQIITELPIEEELDPPHHFPTLNL